ncbi:MAG: hypothetical protein ACRDOU_02625 [Streptosporangiaceae bacterium]
MRLSQRQDQGSPGLLPAGTAGCAAPPAHGRGAIGVAARYVRVTGPVLRGPAGVLIAVVFFAVAGAVGGRTGLAVASGYVAVIGTYCLLNFLHCRETHCGVTGPGFLLTAAFGFAAALVPGPALSWYRTATEAVVFLVILAAGYALEWAVAARTGRRVLR